MQTNSSSEHYVAFECCCGLRSSDRYIRERRSGLCVPFSAITLSQAKRIGPMQIKINARAAFVNRLWGDGGDGQRSQINKIWIVNVVHRQFFGSFVGLLSLFTQSHELHSNQHFATVKRARAPATSRFAPCVCIIRLRLQIRFLWGISERCLMRSGITRIHFWQALNLAHCFHFRICVQNLFVFRLLRNPRRFGLFHFHFIISEITFRCSESMPTSRYVAAGNVSLVFRQLLRRSSRKLGRKHHRWRCH